MRSYNISFEASIDVVSGGKLVRQRVPFMDETQLDVDGDDPAELLVLFDNFVEENGFIVVPGSVSVEEVPYDG